jgi:hypothetical protein
MDMCPPLANDNITGVHKLPAILLDAQPLACAVTTVPRTADPFFMSHDATS